MVREGIKHFGQTRGRERILSCRTNQSPPDRILFDIFPARVELLDRSNLHLIEPSLPNVSLALQAKRESALDELQGSFERNIWSWGEQKMEMIRHDHKRVQFKPMLASIALEHIEHQSCRRLDLKEPAAISRHSRDEISAYFLRCEFHISRIKTPFLKALRCASHRFRGLKAHAPSVPETVIGTLQSALGGSSAAISSLILKTSP